MKAATPSFRILRPAFAAGLLDDPILLVQNRVTGRSLLFDCGQLHHLAKRVLMSLEAVFISHAHMDHLMGIDLLFRHLHAMPRTLYLYGPPGLAERVAHKLQGYDWNLAEADWATFVVNEVAPQELTSTHFVGAAGFAQEPASRRPLADDVIYRDSYLQVRSRTCEHRIPSLIFRVEERPFFLIAPDRLAAQGYRPGPWLGQLKQRLAGEADDDRPFRVVRHIDGIERIEQWDDVSALYQTIQRIEPPGGVGYITDIGWNAQNRRQVRALMAGVKLLVCECTFRAAEMNRARSSAHLCTRDLSELCADIQPEALLPMHMSKRYRDQGETLYQELSLPDSTALIRIPQFVTAAPLTLTEFF